MKYIVSWIPPQSRFTAAAARSLQAGGMPRAPVKMRGRWHGMNGGGFAMVETTDAKALYAWFAELNEFLSVSLTPCSEDADAGAVLASLKREPRAKELRCKMGVRTARIHAQVVKIRGRGRPGSRTASTVFPNSIDWMSRDSVI